MWIQTFGPATDKIKQLVKEANLVIQKSTAWDKISKALVVVSRKASNLGDLILKKKKNCSSEKVKGADLVHLVH